MRNRNGKIRITKTNLTDVCLWFEPAVFGDHRAFFTESYSQEDFKAAGLDYAFVQDNHSLSSGSRRLKGLTLSKRRGCPNEIDSCRDGSRAGCNCGYPKRKVRPMVNGKGYIFIGKATIVQLLVPKGFAHGFVTLTPNVNFLYNATTITMLKQMQALRLTIQN